MTPWPGNAKKQGTTFGGLARSQLMSRVRSKGNVTTEIRLKSQLRHAGIHGWRRHLTLPGRPDFAWPKERVAVFTHGCFWHGHRCGKNISPKTNRQEWEAKIAGNRARDARVARTLRRQGWVVMRIWECQLAKDPNRCVRRIKRALENSGNY